MSLSSSHPPLSLCVSLSLSLCLSLSLFVSLCLYWLTRHTIHATKMTSSIMGCVSNYLWFLLEHNFISPTTIWGFYAAQWIWLQVARTEWIEEPLSSFIFVCLCLSVFIFVVVCLSFVSLCSSSFIFVIFSLSFIFVLRLSSLILVYLPQQDIVFQLYFIPSY